MFVTRSAAFNAKASKAANDRAGGLTRYEQDVTAYLAKAIGSAERADQILEVARIWASSFRAAITESAEVVSPTSDVVVYKIAAELKVSPGAVRSAMARYADAIRRQNCC